MSDPSIASRVRPATNAFRPEASAALIASGINLMRNPARLSARRASAIQSATSAAKSASCNFWATGSEARKLTSMNLARLSAMRSWFSAMMAVCGIGNPSGRLNSATTAYQSARPPIIAASEKAPSQAKAGCFASSNLARRKSSPHKASNAVAASLTLRSALAFRTSSPAIACAFGPSCRNSRSITPPVMDRRAKESPQRSSRSPPDH